ncbi:MAG TPA: choice-of-anchor J domain-containing protein, partial [Anaerolineae bacterium]|nr:choice-of-anchor J domain-containing protein [Anaerolineae bacterium]
DDWFFSPPLQLSAGTTYGVEFYYRALRSYRSEQMEVFWGTAPSPAGMTGGQIWSSPGFTNTDYAGALTTAVTPATAGVYYIGWHATSPNGEGIHVDDVGVGIPPSSCAGNPLPADGATGVGRNADLSWSAAADATGYKLYFGTDSPPTNLANGIDLGNATTYDPGSMAYGALHTWRIVPYNAYGEAAGCPAWSFTTEANPVLVTTFPYTENFDGVTAPALPDGWEVANGATANDVRWATNTAHPRSSPNAMAIAYDPDSALDDWFFSPPLQLTAGRVYQVKFYRRARNSDYTERLEVLWGTAPTAAGMTGGQIWNDSFSGTTYSQETTSLFTPAASGVYFIGWHGYSLANKRGIYVDDISLALTLDCPTNPTPADGATGVDVDANLSWSGATGATGYRVYFGTDNPPTNIANGALALMPSYNAPPLADGTPHYWRIKPYNADGEITNCPVWSFTTLSHDYGAGGGYNFANSTPGAAGSPWGQPTYQWIAEQSHEVTAWTSGNANDGYVTVDLAPYLGGAGFPFFGTTYTSLHIGSNGLLAFGSPPSTTSYGTDSFPSTTNPDNLLAGAWMNLDLSHGFLYSDAHLYYGGDATRFVVTYWHAHQYSLIGSPNYVTFQIILYPTGRIVAQYNQAESYGTTSGVLTSIEGDAIIGIENVDGTQGIGYRVNGAGGPMFGSDLALAMAPVGVPLAVDLAGFAAEAQSNQVVVTWETVSELNNAGFNLYRSSLADGAGRALLAFVPAQSPGSTAGASYRYADAGVAAGQTYWYWLEDVDLSGATTLHGPVSATANTPTAVTLGSMAASHSQGPAGLPPAALPAAAALALAAIYPLRRRR